MSRLGRLGVSSLLVWALCLFTPVGAQTIGDSVIVVSRARILTETDAALALHSQERADRQRLKEWVTAQTKFLDREEQRLTELRPETPNVEFERLTKRFDQTVRRIRRTAQRLDVAIQARFRNARKELVTALYPVLIDIIKQEGATLVIDSDHILIADPRIEKTEDAIALYNLRVEPPVFEEFIFPALGETNNSSATAVTPD